MSAPIGRETPQRRAMTYRRKTESLARRPAPKVVVAAVYHMKVVGDQQVVVTGDAPGAGNRLSFWAIEEDIDGMELSKVEIDVTTVSSSGIVQVQLRNVDNGNVDMLSTRVQIDAGETHSRTAATAMVVNGANAGVAHGDRIAIDIDDDGTGAMGLGLVSVFVAPA